MGQVYVWYLNQLDDYNSIVTRMSELDSKRMNENLLISGASVSTSDQLNITVVNNGGTTVHIVSLLVINETDDPDTHTRSDVDAFVSSGGTGTVTGTANYGDRLTLRLVTELGNLFSYRIAPASEIPNLRMTLDANPPTVIGSHDVGVTLLVFNNNTEYGALYNLTIKAATDNIDYDYTGSGQDVTLTPPITTTIDSIRSGETAAFTWKYSINVATPGQTFTFKGRYNGASSFAEATAEVVTPFGREEAEALSEVIGTLRIQISSFGWSQDDGASWNNASFLVPKNKDTVWRINVTNTHIARNVTLNSYSAITFLESSTGTVKIFHIIEAPKTPPPGPSGRVHPYDDLDDIAGYPDPVVILPGATVTIYFSATSAGGQNQQSTGVLGSWASFIVLTGIYDNDSNYPYGQSIPFIAVRTF